MKTNNFKNIKTGVFTLLPLILFFLIIKWIIQSIFSISDTLFLIIPTYNNFNNPQTGDLYFHSHIIGATILILLLWGIGWIMNHYYIGKKINEILNPLIKKTPILNTLHRIGKQVNEISQNKTSFKEVVLVEFPAPGMYSIGFITSESTKTINNILGKDSISVFIPTTPNPTNGFQVFVIKEKIIRTKIPVEKGFEYVISMGTLIDFETVEKITTTPSI